MTNKQTDLPFIYAITPANLQDSNIVLPTDNDGAEFHLRRIVFGSTLGGPDSALLTNFQMYDREYRSFTNQLSNPTNERIIVPEVVYRSGDALRFDHAPSDGEATVYFQGIRRFKEPVNPLPSPLRQGNWLERPFQYVSSVAVPTTGSQLINYNLDIRNYDFELRRIFLFDADNGGVQSSGRVTVTLLNAYKRQMMNQAIPDWLLNSGSNDLTNVFPVPGIIYPIGSFIAGVVQYAGGEVEPPATRNFSVVFDGVQRFPCA